MRELLFRAWDNQVGQYFKNTNEAYAGKIEQLFMNMSGDLCIRTMDSFIHESMFPGRFIVERWTGLEDKNGVRIFHRDLLRIRRTLNNGEYVSDAVYRVEYGDLGGVEFVYQELFGNDENNQIPINQRLCERNGSLGFWVVNGKRVLSTLDTWSENTMSRKRWKSSDRSEDIEVIGNVHEGVKK